MDAPPYAAPPSRPRAASVPLHPSALTVGYVYAAEMTAHFNPAGHPECPDRIVAIYHALVMAHYSPKMKWIPIRPVRREEALLVHSEDHWDKVLAIQHMSEQEIADSEDYYEQLSLYVMQGTTRAALLSCGGVVEACLAVARGDLQKAFAIVRPPGHHAEPDEHMGFCFFNNVAVAAKVVQQVTPLKRIMILDWDVHHGNGTQRAFNDDPSVLYVSLHRYEQGTFYPCGPFGGMQSCGEGPGLGYSVNIPWPQNGMTDADYLHAFQKIVMPIALEFAPELVIISAGFDAAAGDDLGECHVTPAGYAHMTHMLAGLAGGKLAVALEGGYNLESISNSALAVVKVLLGEAPDELPPLIASEAGTETVYFTAREQSRYWKGVDPKTCEPREGLEDVSFSIPEILKAHRQHYLFTQHGMLQIPLVSKELEDRFSAQITCSANIFETKTLIFLAHEFGNLRFELVSSATCDVELERSYLLDTSKELINWINREKYGLVDINLYPKSVATPLPVRSIDSYLKRDIVTYLWDNFVQLSNAERIVLIGHGPGCQPMMELIENRFTSVKTLVKMVIQVVGISKIPSTPRNDDEMRIWYKNASHQYIKKGMPHSWVVIPSIHPILGPEIKAKDLRRHGHLVPMNEIQPIRVFLRALGGIQALIKTQLEQPDTNGSENM
ncbi:histone deacetylase complex protein [Amanita rubescens]|nr:histone deacetylase complex protein [Amanita rubescens]